MVCSLLVPSKQGKCIRRLGCKDYEGILGLSQIRPSTIFFHGVNIYMVATRLQSIMVPYFVVLARTFSVMIYFSPDEKGGSALSCDKIKHNTTKHIKEGYDL